MYLKLNRLFLLVEVLHQLMGSLYHYIYIYYKNINIYQLLISFVKLIRHLNSSTGFHPFGPTLECFA